LLKVLSFDTSVKVKVSNSKSICTKGCLSKCKSVSDSAFIKSNYTGRLYNALYVLVLGEKVCL